VTIKLWVSDFKHGKTRQALETSLSKLGLDSVDLYLIHWPAPADEKYLDAWSALEQLQSEGMTRSIGVSNFIPEHPHRVAETGSVIPAVNQVEIDPALQQRDIQAANEKYGIATQAWSPLAQGAALSTHPDLWSERVQRPGATRSSPHTCRSSRPAGAGRDDRLT
jgi:2,5-diketo-D-gluconate reductase A